MEKPLCNNIDQIGIFVYSIDKYVQYFEKIFGKNAFKVVEYESVKIFEDGREEKIKTKKALLQLGNIELELIEIIEGPAFLREWLKEHGEGIHHLGMVVSNFEQSLKEFKEAGINILHQGRGRRRYAYLDTKPFCLEIAEKLPD